MKRVLANRQSAQRSRIRKLQHISELEETLQGLQDDVHKLTPQLTKLQAKQAGSVTPLQGPAGGLPLLAAAVVTLLLSSAMSLIFAAVAPWCCCCHTLLLSLVFASVGDGLHCVLWLLLVLLTRWHSWLCPYQACHASDLYFMDCFKLFLLWYC